MTEDAKSFETRLNRIDRTTNGGWFKRRRDKGEASWGVPILHAVLCGVFVYGALTFAKVTLIQELGRAGYDGRLAQLSSGNSSQRVAAQLMRRDSVLDFIETKI